MKFTIFTVLTILAGLLFLLPGMQITGAYYAEPSGYGFYHVWYGNLLLSVSITLFGIAAMLFIVRIISMKLF